VTGPPATHPYVNATATPMNDYELDESVHYSELQSNDSDRPNQTVAPPGDAHVYSDVKNIGIRANFS